jgi:hypothetical protein
MDVWSDTSAGGSGVLARGVRFRAWGPVLSDDELATRWVGAQERVRNRFFGDWNLMRYLDLFEALVKG